MWASVLVGVFWRGEELAAGRGVARKSEAYRMVAVWFRYKFMTWRWFCVGCFSVQLLPDLSKSRDFDLSPERASFKKAPFAHMEAKWEVGHIQQTSVCDFPGSSTKRISEQ